MKFKPVDVDITISKNMNEEKFHLFFWISPMTYGVTFLQKKRISFGSIFLKNARYQYVNKNALQDVLR